MLSFFKIYCVSYIYGFIFLITSEKSLSLWILILSYSFYFCLLKLVLHTLQLLSLSFVSLIFHIYLVVSLCYTVGSETQIWVSQIINLCAIHKRVWSLLYSSGSQSVIWRPLGHDLLFSSSFSYECRVEFSRGYLMYDTVVDWRQK